MLNSINILGRLILIIIKVQKKSQGTNEDYPNGQIFFIIFLFLTSLIRVILVFVSFFEVNLYLLFVLLYFAFFGITFLLVDSKKKKFLYLFQGDLQYLILIYKNGLPMFDYDFSSQEIITNNEPNQNIQNNQIFANIRYLMYITKANFENFTKKCLDSGQLKDLEIQSVRISIYRTENILWVLFTKENSNNHFFFLQRNANKFERKYRDDLEKLSIGFVATEEMKNFCKEQWKNF
ncbi:MAG: hypothetical protein K9W44_13980 [Candidatus Lokiarchaeota archaeon]|nr:hypothetical protein [Candidatus Harpocratesius repetitus]